MAELAHNARGCEAQDIVPLLQRNYLDKGSRLPDLQRRWLLQMTLEQSHASLQTICLEPLSDTVSLGHLTSCQTGLSGSPHFLSGFTSILS